MEGGTTLWRSCFSLPRRSFPLHLFHWTMECFSSRIHIFLKRRKTRGGKLHINKPYDSKTRARRKSPQLSNLAWKVQSPRRDKFSPLFTLAFTAWAPEPKRAGASQSFPWFSCRCYSLCFSRSRSVWEKGWRGETKPLSFLSFLDHHLPSVPFGDVLRDWPSDLAAEQKTWKSDSVFYFSQAGLFPGTGGGFRN